MREAHWATSTYTVSQKRLWRFKRRILRLTLWGIVSLAAYLLLFLNQESVTHYFTKGGVFAVGVVIMPLAFSLIHGTFANYVLELLGIQPHGKEGH